MKQTEEINNIGTSFIQNEPPQLFTGSFICLLLANFLLFYSFWLLIPVLPFYLKENFNLTEGYIGAILACYTIAALLVRPFSGYILDTFSRKPIYILSYAVFTIVFAGYIIGGTLILFVILRLVHGLSFGTVTVGGNTLVIDIMPSERRGEGLGYFGLTNNIAMSIGPMTGLLLHTHYPYPIIFGIGGTVCLIGFLLALCVKVTKKKIIRPNNQPTQISLDRFLLLKGILAGISLMLIAVPYGATTNYVAMYIDSIGISFEPGLFFTLMALGMGTTRIFAGRYVDQGYITTCIHTGFYFIVSAFLLLGLGEIIYNWNHDYAIIAFFVIPASLGIGFGIMFPAYNSLYINLAHHNQRATATSTYLTSWDVGIGLGILTSGIIAEQVSFAGVFLYGSILSLLSMIFFVKIVIPHYHKNKMR